MDWMDEFTTKFGFDDGNNMPDGVEEVRELFIAALNHYAKEKDSSFRAYAYNRGGLHNWCMIIFAPKDTQDPVKEAVWNLAHTDLAFCDAVKIVRDMEDDLTLYIHIAYEVDSDVYEKFGFDEPDTLECRQCYATAHENTTIVNGLCADCAKNNAQKKENMDVQ